MHRLALFSHAFKTFNNGQPDKMRLCYRVYDLQSETFLVSHMSEVYNAPQTGTNAPHALACYMALTDPVLDKVQRTNTVLFLFNNHHLIHQALKRYIFNGSSRFDKRSGGAYKSTLENCFKLLNRQRTVSIWNNCKDESNHCRRVLYHYGNQFVTHPGELTQENEKASRVIADSIDYACLCHLDDFTDHFLRLARKESIYEF